MLQKVDKSDIDNLDEQQRQNVMITSEGEYVLAQADKKTWQKFQDQKNANDAAQKNVHSGSAELQTLGLECPVDKRLFVDPMKTPCCGKTYCRECIENALLDGDLRCPNCQTENVSLEGLQVDQEVIEKIKEYNTSAEAGNPSAINAEADGKRGSNSGSRSQSPKSPGSVAGRKRTASEATETKEGLDVPVTGMKRQKSSGGSNTSTPTMNNAQPATAPVQMMPDNQDFNAIMQQMSQASNMNMPGNMSMMNPMMMNPLMMGMMPNMGGMPVMPNFNNMNNGFMNMNPNQNWGNDATGQDWNNQQRSQGWNGQQGQWNQNSVRGGHRNNKKFNHQQKHNSTGPPQGLENVPKGPKAMKTGGPAMATSIPTGPSSGKFSNQQRHQNEEDNAYLRQPVNPQRAMNRDRGRRGMRNAEYKELGQ